MGELIEARSMTKLYGVVIGVNDVDLDLDPGVIGLLGPNGAGKSTFLKLITMTKTSSGKRRHRHFKELYLRGALQQLAVAD